MHRVSPLNESLAREIAERSVAPVLRQLGTVAKNMPWAELRGYVRAHAISQVQNEARQLVGNDWPQAAFNDLVATALELATHSLLQQLKGNLTVAVPTPHIRLRHAA